MQAENRVCLRFHEGGGVSARAPSSGDSSVLRGERPITPSCPLLRAHDCMLSGCSLQTKGSRGPALSQTLLGVTRAPLCHSDPCKQASWRGKHTALRSPCAAHPHVLELSACLVHDVVVQVLADAEVLEQLVHRVLRWNRSQKHECHSMSSHRHLRRCIEVPNAGMFSAGAQGLPGHGHRQHDAAMSTIAHDGCGSAKAGHVVVAGPLTLTARRMAPCPRGPYAGGPRPLRPCSDAEGADEGVHSREPRHDTMSSGWGMLGTPAACTPAANCCARQWAAVNNWLLGCVGATRVT